MKRFMMLVIILLVLIPDSSLYACTGILIQKGDFVLFGNNEDWKNPNTRVWYVPAEEGKYGRVYFEFDNFNPQGGMNEKGLVFDAFATWSNKVIKSLDKPTSPRNLMDKVMSECATVNEALIMFDKYNLAFMEKEMFFIADEHGNSVIIEGDNVVRKKGKYQVRTNFYQSEIKKEDIRCDRYKIATAMLENTDDVSIDLGKRVLAATHQEGLYPTVYSNVYDLKRRIVYLYHFHNFQNEVIIDLKAELAKGAHRIDLPDLFPRSFAAENFKNSSAAEFKKQNVMKEYTGPDLEKPLAFGMKRYISQDGAYTIDIPDHWFPLPHEEEKDEVGCFATSENGLTSIFYKPRYNPWQSLEDMRDEQIQWNTSVWRDFVKSEKVIGGRKVLFFDCNNGVTSLRDCFFEEGGYKHFAAFLANTKDGISEDLLEEYEQIMKSYNMHK